jgi:hypothetical protein
MENPDSIHIAQQGEMLHLYNLIGQPIHSGGSL